MTKIIEYNPISLLHELSDEMLIGMIESGDMNEFCMSLTLDLNQVDKKIEC